MKRLTLLVTIVASVASGCGEIGDYLKHDLEYEKNGSCGSVDPGVNLEANTIGERYTFFQCLDADYKGQYTVERHGDTVKVIFPKPSSNPVRYQLKLDINTHPAYRTLDLNGNVVKVNVTRY